MGNLDHFKFARRGGESFRKWREQNPYLTIVLDHSHLEKADLAGADLSKAIFTDSNLCGANFSEANLTWAILNGACLRGAILTGANLSCVNMIETDFSSANLEQTDFTDATCRGTSFSDVDLSSSKGLSEMRHLGPSYIDLHTLSKSKGNIPEKFLRDCGLTQWQITAARLHDPNLTPSEIAEIQTIIFQQRTKGPLFIGGSFISYSWFDRIFVDKLYTRLQQEELSVWLDRHELVAGEIQKQIFDAIRLNDIVILVLSEASTQSDWVENELEMARRKEKEEHRAVLCPIALDDSWKAKMEPTQPNRALWLTIKQKLVIDFTEWDKNKAFEHQFQKLLRGLKRNYKLASQESVGRSIGSWLTSLTKTSEVS